MTKYTRTRHEEFSKEKKKNTTFTANQMIYYKAKKWPKRNQKDTVPVTYILNRKIIVAGLDRVAAWSTYFLDVTFYISPHKEKARILLQIQFVLRSIFFCSV